MDISGSLGVITGGTGALGSSIAVACLQAGSRVAVTYHAEMEWQALRRRAGEAGLSRLEGLAVDLTDAAATQKALRPLCERPGGVRFLVCAAGGFEAGTGYDTDDATWKRMLDLNLRAAVNAVRTVAPAMIADRAGAIVTVASASILQAPGAGIAAYAVSKAALSRWSEILAVELGPHNIAVRCVLPGTMDTPANRRATPDADPAQWLKTEVVAARILDLIRAGGADPRPVLVPIER